MPTVLVVYNAKDAKNADDYEQYLKSKKIPLLRSKPYIKSFDMWRVEQVLAPAMVGAKNPPSEPPYQFIAKCEVTSLEEFGQDNHTPPMEAFFQEFSAYLDTNGPLNVFTLGHKIEP